MLSELGFRIRLLGWGGADAFRSVVAELNALPSPDRPELTLLEAPEELPALLANPDVGAVYSSFTADPRATRAGRCVFSEHDFEMGFAGFVRTGQRLLDMCERRPLRGFERFLGAVS